MFRLFRGDSLRMKRVSSYLRFLTMSALVLAANGCAVQPITPPSRLGALPMASSAPSIPDSPVAYPRPTDTVLVAGESVSVGTRVVLFDEPGGYNAYYGPSYFNQRRASAERSDPAPDREALKKLIDRVVLHYDGVGLSSRCFRTLQQERGLSCHFLLDIDGIIYQTLDLEERAWHAGTSNSRSVGIEIANVGAYPMGSANPLSHRYRPHPVYGTQLILPPDAAIRLPGRARGPARPSPITGPIHGRRLMQFDLTDAQYESLVKLVAALCRAFPRVTADAPRVDGDPTAAVLPGLMTAADRVRFAGVVGHHHLTRAKFDPGPAFDWQRLLRGVRSELGNPAFVPNPGL